MGAKKLVPSFIKATSNKKCRWLNGINKPQTRTVAVITVYGLVSIMGRVTQLKGTGLQSDLPDAEIRGCMTSCLILRVLAE